MEFIYVKLQFISCIRGVLKGCVPESFAGTFLEQDWERLFEISEKHHVLPMIYESLSRMEDFGGMPEKGRKIFRKYAMAEVMLQTRKNRELCRIYEKIRKEGYDCVLLKGMVCGEAYSRPAHRISSDEDLLVRPADRRAVHQILMEAGYERTSEGSGEESLVWCYDKAGEPLHIELHRGLFPDGRLMNQMDGALTGCFDRRVERELEGTVFQVLDATDEVLYLFFHAMKHFMGCGTGIRQICDILQFARHLEKKIDWQCVYEKLHRAGGISFAVGIFQFGEDFLGCTVPVPWMKEKRHTEEEMYRFLEDVLQGGVYGKSSEGRIAGGVYTSCYCNHEEPRSMGRLVLERLFPAPEWLAGRYPVLKEKRYLLPFLWIHRIWLHVKKLGLGKNGRQAVNMGMRKGRERIPLLEEFGIPMWRRGEKSR